MLLAEWLNIRIWKYLQCDIILYNIYITNNWNQIIICSAKYAVKRVSCKYTKIIFVSRRVQKNFYSSTIFMVLMVTFTALLNSIS